MALLEPSAPSQARPASMPRPWTAAALATPRRETVRRREPGTAATVAVAAASPALPRRAADGADGDLGRATMYASAGDVELHRVALENVALAHPDSPQAATALLAAADLHATQGEVREADAAYRQVTALRHAPAMSQALAYKALGDLRRETVGDDELAAHHYRMAAQVLRSAASSGAANDQLRMLTALGQVQETLGEVDNAASAYTRAATLSAGPKVATGTGARLSQTL
jgi:tetratricopeptide (TPR) repeat protein